MASSASNTPSLTPSRSPSPEPPVQPDHFYGNDTVQLPPSPSSDGKTWLDPADDPLAQRGIPVFKPTMQEFRDFEAYVTKVECWGSRSGIVKIIPPKEWTDALPSLIPQLAKVKLKNPIEQHMFGRGGLFRQENVEKRKIMSVREWAELCAKEDLRGPGVDDIGLHARAANGSAKPRTRRGRRKTRDPETAEPEMTPGVRVKDEPDDDEDGVDVARVSQNDVTNDSLASPPDSTDTPPTPVPGDHAGGDRDREDAQSALPVHGGHSNTTHPSPAPDAQEEAEPEGEKPKSKPRRIGQTKEVREAHLAERAVKDEAFLESFDPHSDWLPANTTQFDYTPEFCKELERRYWRNCGLGKPAWYGADMQGSLFTDETTSWNVAHLPSALSRLLPASSQGLPGVNTPYLYFGMWRATFAWHVEDMDLFSINYIHYGAPKFWYAMPQARANALEQTMKSYFPKDISQCPQFLRHKSFLASPTLLSQSSCKPNCLVQSAGEFVITFPKGYHAGFNLGFNCAESVNFALESWLDLGRKAKSCQCVNYSVRINVDELLRERDAERALNEAAKVEKPAKAESRKRKSDAVDGGAKPKKPRRSKKDPKSTDTPTAGAKPLASKVTLKLGPKPKEPEAFPCCLCVSTNTAGLLRVQDPPTWRKEGDGGVGGSSGEKIWMAHEECAKVVPETWVDEMDLPSPDGTRERVVFGVDAIVKDRWNLKCSACTKTRNKAHGAPIQCTKGRCPKAFHVSCARDGTSNGIIYQILQEVEKEVVLVDPLRPIPESSGVGSVVVEDSSAGAAPMDVDAPASGESSVNPQPQVLKLIKKFEVQVLCSQHNPAIAEAKKADKQEKIRKDLLALPPMTRIKLRVSAGVFEVSLLRVIEESKSVEVLWDRGVKREFKWGSVVFGNTEGVVGQKPTELAPEPDRSVTATPSSQVSTQPFPPLQSTPATIEFRPARYQSQVPALPAAPDAPVPSTSSYPPVAHPYTPATVYQQGSMGYHSQYSAAGWPYSYPGYTKAPYPAGQSAHPQTHYYPPVSRPAYNGTSSYPQYGGYNHAAASSSGVSLYQAQPPPRRELQWQRPYTGPRNSAGIIMSNPSASFSAMSYSPVPGTGVGGEAVPSQNAPSSTQVNETSIGQQNQPATDQLSAPTMTEPPATAVASS